MNTDRVYCKFTADYDKCQDFDFEDIFKNSNELEIVDPKEGKRVFILKNKIDKDIKDWLNSFNTDSATECFTAVQQLKEKMNERKD